MEKRLDLKAFLAILLVLVILLAVFKLISAGNEVVESLKGENTEQEKSEVVTLHFIHWSNIPKRIFGAFSEKYPNIKVEYEQFGRQHYADVQRSRMSSGENVDLMEVMENDYYSMSNNGYLVELSGKDFLRNYREDSLAALAELRNDKKLYSVPYKSWVLGIWYNKIQFNKYRVKVPETYEELLEACSLLKANGIAPMVMGCKDEFASSYFYYTRLPNSAGSDGEWFSKLNSGELNWTSQDILNNLGQMGEFVKKGFLLKDSIHLTSNQAFHEFARGRSAMCLAGDWSLDMIQPGVDKTGDLGVFPIPYNDPSGKMLVPGTKAAFMLGVFSGSMHKEETELLLKYLSQPEVAQIYTDETKAASTIRNVSFKGVKYNELWEPLRGMELMTPHSNVFSNSFQKKFNRSAKNLIAGLKKPKQILEELEQERN